MSSVSSSHSDEGVIDGASKGAMLYEGSQVDAGGLSILVFASSALRNQLML